MPSYSITILDSGLEVGNDSFQERDDESALRAAWTALALFATRNKHIAPRLSLVLKSGSGKAVATCSGAHFSIAEGSKTGGLDPADPGGRHRKLSVIKP